MKNVLFVVLAFLLWLQVGGTARAQGCDWPDASNVGLTNPGILASVSSPTITTSGTAVKPYVYENKRVGSIVVKASYVVIRNCRITGGLYGIKTDFGCRNVTVEDCELACSAPNNNSAIFAAGTNILIQRNYIHTWEDGILVFATNIQIKDNFITNLKEYNGSHNDNIHLYGSSNVLIKHNNLQMPNQQTACIGGHGDAYVNGITIESNLLNGGAYTIYTRKTDHGGFTNVTIVGNHIGRDYVFGVLSTDVPVTAACNVWADNGQPCQAIGSNQSNCGQYSCRFEDLNRVARVIISPEGGTYTGSVAVSLSTKTDGAQIRYTTDGRDPNSGSTLYNGAMTISTEGSTTLKARGFKTGLDSSVEASASFTINVDRAAPVISSVVASGDPNKVYVAFSETVDKSTAEDKANYAVNGITINSASLSSDQKTVTLTTTVMTGGQGYTLTVNNIKDLWNNPIAANSQKDFTYLAVDPALTGWWQFDNNAFDASGNNRTATLSGGATYGTGQAGQALTLDGNDDYVALPVATASGATDFTFCAWVKPGSSAPYLRIFDFNDGTLASQSGGKFMYLSNAYGSNGGWTFRITTAGWGTAQHITTDAPLPVNQWTHVAITLEGNTGTLYQDGVAGKNGAITLDPKTLGLVNLWLGRSAFSEDPYFPGSQDEVRIYNRALSAGEISALYNTTAGIRDLPSTRKTQTNVNLKITPNPAIAGAVLTITGKDMDGLSNIELRDLAGSLVKPVVITQREGHHTLDLRAVGNSLLSAGMYLITFKLDGGWVTRQVIITR